MITQIEHTIIERLQRGLGRMVRTVKSYNGEADDLAGQIMTLPAIWITYGGCQVNTGNTAKTRYQNKHEIVVMLATRSLRNEVSQRHGGIDKREVGNNDLLYAVRRLLDGQRLGGNDSRGLIPQAVRTIVNHTLVQNAAVSIYAVEYAFYMDSIPLEDGRFPERCDDPSYADHIFTKYNGELSEPYPDFLYLDGHVFDTHEHILRRYWRAGETIGRPISQMSGYGRASVVLDINLKKDSK